MQFKTVIVALMLAATATAMPRGLHEWGLLSGPWADASNWLDKLHVLLNIFGKGLHDAPHCDLSRVQVPTGKSWLYRRSDSLVHTNCTRWRYART